MKYDKIPEKNKFNYVDEGISTWLSNKGFFKDIK